VRIIIQGLLIVTSILFIAQTDLTPGTTAVLAGSNAKDRGAQLFATRGCVRCHGKEGIGGGKGPDLQLVRKRLKPAAMAKQIRDGGLEMPAFGASLTDQEIKNLVAYLRAKRKVIVPRSAAAIAPLPPVVKPDTN
jgi:ubiquinol-cytochrome c reductase cytochrome b subunit